MSKGRINGKVFEMTKKKKKNQEAGGKYAKCSTQIYTISRDAPFVCRLSVSLGGFASIVRRKRFTF